MALGILELWVSSVSNVSANLINHFALKLLTVSLGQHRVPFAHLLVMLTIRLVKQIYNANYTASKAYL